MANTKRFDPYKNYKFRLEIDGIVQAGFHECSGLPSETAELPGLHKTGDVTLKRGVIGELALWEWHKEAAKGKTQRKNGSIILMDDLGPVKRWNFKNGWPMKWTGPSLNATAKEVPIEALEIAHEGLTEA